MTLNLFALIVVLHIGLLNEDGGDGDDDDDDDDDDDVQFNLPGFSGYIFVIVSVHQLFTQLQSVLQL